jgi:AAA+ ATPase superfamily predicted ATPase
VEFHDRVDEIQQLDRLLDRGTSQLVVVFGRRRIGKTRLLTRWLAQQRGTQGVYWVAHRTSSDILLRGFSRALTTALDPQAGEMVFPTWEAAIGRLFALAREQRTIAVIDEFPYLVRSVPALPSLLQALWDQHQQGSDLVLVLCGSHYQMMHDELLSPRRPLFGRATATLLLDEIAPEQLRLFLPRYSPEQIVETYAVIGGVPKYLELWDDRVPVLRNIEQLILSPVTIFRHEAMFLIQDELAEPRTYLAILESLGAGLKGPKQLSERSGIAVNHMGKYLSTLLDLRLVRRVLSSDVFDRRQSRATRYEIRDPFMRFHFQFIYRHPELVEQNRMDRLVEIIRRGFDSHVGSSGYEELARRHVAALGEADRLPFRPEVVGRAWNREVDLDVVAVDHRSRSALLAECKWTRTKLGPDVLQDLRRRAARLRRLGGYHRHFALFSRAGFTKGLIRQAARENVLLFSGAEFAAQPP